MRTAGADYHRRISEEHSRADRERVKAETRRRGRSLLFRVVAAVAVVVLGALWFTTSNVFNVAEVVVSGNSAVSEEFVREAGAAPGVNIFSANLRRIRANLLANPYVAEADISRFIPDKLIVALTERVPRAYIEDKTGGYLLVDGEGVVLAAVAGVSDVSIPVVTGIAFSGYTVGEPLAQDRAGTFENVVALTGAFEKYGILADVDVIDVTNPSDIAFSVGRCRVDIGEPNGADEKIAFFAGAKSQGKIPDMPAVFSIKDAGAGEYLFTIIN